MRMPPPVYAHALATSLHRGANFYKDNFVVVSRHRDRQTDKQDHGRTHTAHSQHIVQLSLTNRPTTNAAIRAINELRDNWPIVTSCAINRQWRHIAASRFVDDVTTRPDFARFTYLSPIWRHQWEGFLWSIGFIFDTGKTRMAGLQSGEVAWWSTHSFGHNTSTWQTQTTTSP